MSLDKEIIKERETRHCAENGKYCHIHSNCIRNFIHNLHCMYVKCPESKYYQ